MKKRKLAFLAPILSIPLLTSAAATEPPLNVHSFATGDLFDVNAFINLKIEFDLDPGCVTARDYLITVKVVNATTGVVKEWATSQVVLGTTTGYAIFQSIDNVLPRGDEGSVTFSFKPAAKGRRSARTINITPIDRTVSNPITLSDLSSEGKYTGRPYKIHYIEGKGVYQDRYTYEFFNLGTGIAEAKNSAFPEDLFDFRVSSRYGGNQYYRAGSHYNKLYPLGEDLDYYGAGCDVGRLGYDPEFKMEIQRTEDFYRPVILDKMCYNPITGEMRNYSNWVRSPWEDFLETSNLYLRRVPEGYGDEADEAIVVNSFRLYIGETGVKPDYFDFTVAITNKADLIGSCHKGNICVGVSH